VVALIALTVGLVFLWRGSKSEIWFSFVVVAVIFGIQGVLYALARLRLTSKL